ncbi:hypothetical protein, partial [Pseudomonas carnis]|uniref:hypothetical protein n=1 Tax=Pseudomonas carnis TaxID=2487355 RepID=UPI001F2ECC93
MLAVSFANHPVFYRICQSCHCARPLELFARFAACRQRFTGQVPGWGSPFLKYTSSKKREKADIHNITRG